MGSVLALIAVCVGCLVQKGKRKRSRPSTASNTPVKDVTERHDVSEPVKDGASETVCHVEAREASQPAVAKTCEPKPAEEPAAPDSSATVSATPPAQPTVKEKSTKPSKDRSDRKRERRRERKSESGSPAVQAPDRASPVCNGTAADDMNVCK